MVDIGSILYSDNGQSVDDLTSLLLFRLNRTKDAESLFYRHAACQNIQKTDPASPLSVRDSLVHSKVQLP